MEAKHIKKVPAMELTAETRLAKALDTIPGALDYIVGLNPHDFSRLNNPILRKYMAPRITLGRIAAMVKMPEERLLHDLAALAEGHRPGRRAGRDQPPGPSHPPARRPGSTPPRRRGPTTSTCSRSTTRPATRSRRSTWRSSGSPPAPPW